MSDVFSGVLGPQECDDVPYFDFVSSAIYKYNGSFGDCGPHTAGSDEEGLHRYAPR